MLYLYSVAHHSTPPCAINLYLVPPEALSVQCGPSFNSTLCHEPLPSTARGSVCMVRHIKQLHCAINLYLVTPEALSVQRCASFNSTLCHNPVPSTARGSVCMVRYIKQLHCAINLYTVPQFNNEFHYARLSLHKTLYLVWD